MEAAARLGAISLAATLAVGALMFNPAQAEALRLPFGNGSAPTMPSALEMKVRRSIGSSMSTHHFVLLIDTRVCIQAPKDPATSGLTTEEIQNVELFIRNTPSVVNIANIGGRKSVGPACLGHTPGLHHLTMPVVPCSHQTELLLHERPGGACWVG